MNKTIIIVHETVWQSYARDAGTFVMVAGLIGLGVLLDSTAMQWFGALMAFLMLLIRGNRRWHETHMTIQEARAKLDELEARDALHQQETANADHSQD